MPYIEYYDNGCDIELIGETTIDEITKEFGDYIEVSKNELKNMLPIIKKYHKIKRELNKRRKK